jgi:large subunit ribosomal protein L35
MPKMKTHKGLKKRVKVSARGKVRYDRSFAGHLMSGKSSNRRRSLRKPGFLTGANAKRVKTAIGA